VTSFRYHINYNITILCTYANLTHIGTPTSRRIFLRLLIEKLPVKRFSVQNKLVVIVRSSIFQKPSEQRYRQILILLIYALLNVSNRQVPNYRIILYAVSSRQ